LAIFVSDRQDDWFHLLPIAELVFNSSLSSSTGFSPFFAQYSFHPRKNMFNEGSKVPAANKFLENIISVQDTLQDNLHQEKEIQKKYNRTCEVPTYQAGDWVWLLGQNISTTRPSRKLDFKRLGPFKVNLALGKDVYHLILPISLSRVHQVFHTLLLLPFIDPKTFPWRIGSKAPRGPPTIALPALTGQTHRFELCSNHYVQPVIGLVGFDRCSSEPVRQAGPITRQTRQFERCSTLPVWPVNAGRVPALTGQTWRVEHRSNRRI
jgi:hypothetical protein